MKLTSQVLNGMKNVCHSCLQELEAAHTFKLKCDKLNYASRDAASTQSLCELCGESVKNAELKQHHDVCSKKRLPVRTHGKTQMTQAKEKAKINITREALRFRIAAKKGNMWKVQKLERTEKMDKATKTTKTESNPNAFVCPYCKYQFLNDGGLRSHMMWHRIKKNKNQCSSCERSFLHGVDLRKHEKFDH